ncbi:helix-turn-helix domain-containing protein [Pseudomonas sp. 18058]|uniref:helix-turn-helix domain-containing protein n=1 Tax=Pseudomonas sp. 18058 TaxID=2681406 RepID=UPI0013582338|nr:XRE family transcriptional regulator [Pseudomonas sp. 18058]
MKDHPDHNQCFSSIWDALEDTPQNAANMRLRAKLMRTLCETVKSSDDPPKKAAKRLGIGEFQLKDLLKGKIDKFSLDKLLNLSPNHDFYTCNKH